MVNRTVVSSALKIGFDTEEVKTASRLLILRLSLT